MLINPHGLTHALCLFRGLGKKDRQLPPFFLFKYLATFFFGHFRMKYFNFRSFGNFSKWSQKKDIKYKPIDTHKPHFSLSALSITLMSLWLNRQMTTFLFISIIYFIRCVLFLAQLNFQFCTIVYVVYSGEREREMNYPSHFRAKQCICCQIGCNTNFFLSDFPPGKAFEI